jgi:uncharacterized protein (DUF1786 family)
LDKCIRLKNNLSAFAYLAQDVPTEMTRLKSVVDSAHNVDCQLVVMDTAPAAVLGATYDLKVASCQRVLVVNVGNFHTLAFRLGRLQDGLLGIEGLFEHHTGLLDLEKLEILLRALADGSLSHSDVFADHGHGALLYNPTELSLDDAEFDIAVTGPRWNMFKPFVNQTDQRTQQINHEQAIGNLPSIHLRPYFTVPFGDMMIAGCVGLLSATADLIPDFTETIQNSLLDRIKLARAPWDISL